MKSARNWNSDATSPSHPLSVGGILYLQIVLMAVENSNGYALRWAAPELKANREVLHTPLREHRAFGLSKHLSGACSPPPARLSIFRWCTARCP